MNVRILQTVYNEETKANAIFDPYEVGPIDAFFESKNHVAAFEKGLHVDSDYFGIVSPRFTQKTGIGPELLDKIDGEYDYYYPRYYLNMNIWKHGEVSHGFNFIRPAKRLLGMMGIEGDITKPPIPPIFCNFQIVRTALYEQYINEFLRPAIQLMEQKETPLYEELWKQVFYVNRTLSKQQLKEITGVPYHTAHPFICERLFATYAYYQKWRGLALRA